LKPSSQKPGCHLIAPDDKDQADTAAEEGGRCGISRHHSSTPSSGNGPPFYQSARVPADSRSYIASDKGLREIGPPGRWPRPFGDKGKVYVLQLSPASPPTDPARGGFKKEMKDTIRHPGARDPDFNDDDPTRRPSQCSCICRNPDLVGVFGANLFSAPGQQTGGFLQQDGQTGKVRVRCSMRRPDRRHIDAGLVDLANRTASAEIGISG